VRVDQFLQEGTPEAEVAWFPSACVLCSNGCGMDIGVHGGRIVGVRGRADDRVSHGRLGPKGLFGWQASNSPDRLTEPLVRKDGELRPADWNTAMDLVAEQSRQVLDGQGPLGLGFYGSGQLFLEEYYALALIVRAGLGTPHLDGNTRLCTATAGANATVPSRSPTTSHSPLASWRPSAKGARDSWAATRARACFS